MTYDAVMVLGTGIKKNGTLPESCLANVRTAAKLYHDKSVAKLIFAGKWAWNCIYTPPATEGQAMKQFALSLGVLDSDIFVEDETVTTVGNLCQVKDKILIPNNFKNIALICISDIIQPRLEYNLKMILGPDYTSEIILSPSVYSPEKYRELKRSEAKSSSTAKIFTSMLPLATTRLFLNWPRPIYKKIIITKKYDLYRRHFLRHRSVDCPLGKTGEFSS